MKYTGKTNKFHEQGYLRIIIKIFCEQCMLTEYLTVIQKYNWLRLGPI